MTRVKGIADGIADGQRMALKQAIFTVYVLLWVVSHLLIYASRQAGAPEFNATSVVLLTESGKLGLALGMYLRFDGSPEVLARTVMGTLPLLVKYSVPAALYCIYNNLVYTNLASFDPGTYNVLSQLRIVLTGLLYQVLFSKRLSRSQWLSIALIAVGCVTKESSKLGASPVARGAAASAWLLLLAQMLASVFAGVYNEVLLKGSTGSAVVPTNLQNAFLYLSSVGWNLLFLVSKGALRPPNVFFAMVQYVTNPYTYLIGEASHDHHHVHPSLAHRPGGVDSCRAEGASDSRAEGRGRRLCRRQHHAVQAAPTPLGKDTRGWSGRDAASIPHPACRHSLRHQGHGRRRPASGRERGAHELGAANVLALRTALRQSLPARSHRVGVHRPPEGADAAGVRR